MTREPCARRSAPRRIRGLGPAFLFSATACGGTLDAGWDEPRGLLPVDARNPMVLCNDGAYDNWQGEYAMLLASTGGLSMAGIVINDGWPWTNLEENLTGWRQMLQAARASGLKNAPDPIPSPSSALVRPTDGNIESTMPNRSDGARLIIDVSKRLSQPFRPVVVVTGGRLTDVADAYLMDPTLPERVVVVSSLGAGTPNGAEMGVPNGELDTWANVVVARKFRYVQISAFYGESSDVPSSLLTELPANAFTAWIEAKQPKIENAFDQTGILAVALPAFVPEITRVAQLDVNSDDVPVLTRDPTGPDWLVTRIDSSVATTRFSELLLDPATFAGH